MKADDDKNTSLDVNKLRQPMMDLIATGENQSYQWRKQQLATMRRMVTDHQADFAAALHADMQKSKTEAVAMEISMILADLNVMESQLKRWMKPQHVASPGVCFPARTYLQSMPLPLPCLIIGPSNYPCSLSLQPAAGALAAGNSVVIKPSELTPHTAAALAKYCHEYFDPAVLRVVQGGVPETTQLLQQPWGLVLFTGSERIGKIVAAAAAQTLTPTVLELGGKCPCFVDETMPTDVQQVANRILWAKTMNAGQTCAAVDTLIVHEFVLDKLIPALLNSLQIQYGDDPRKSELGRIVSPRHAERLVQLIQEVEEHIKTSTTKYGTAASNDNKSARIVCGGSAACNAKECFIAPTIIVNPPKDCNLMQEEIFGPILPVVTVKSRHEATQYIQNMPGTPLCLYVFTTKSSVLEQVRTSCPAGSVMRNDCLVHLSSPFIPFGGLGTSGYGKYHGKYSFDTFSHMQAVMYRPCMSGLDFKMARYHPFGPTKSWLVTDVLLKVPAIPVMHLPAVLAVLAVLAAAGVAVGCFVAFSKD